MGLKRRMNEDLSAAMKQRDRVRTDCLRMLKTGVKNMEIEKGRELEDAEIQAIVASMIKKGKEAVQDFRKAKRTDLVENEEAPVRVLYEYLPEQLEPEDIEAALKQVIAEIGAEGPRDLGKVMKAAMTKMAGKAPGREVSETAKRLLGA